VFPDLWSLKEKESAFRQFLEDDTRVVSASYSGYLPVGSSYNNNFFLNPLDNNAKSIKTLRYDVDENYIPTLNIEILEGRNFSKQFSTDSTAIILNEAAVKAFDWQDNALGQGLTYSNNEGQKTTYQVVGVVKDFHFKSLHEKISPLVMVLGGNNGAAVMKVNTPDLANLLADLKRNWDELSPDVAFNPSFFDDRIYTTYQAERRVSTLLNIFSSLTIFVACLGLFGLTVFTTERRKKEISVRKVLGATITNIVTLLSKDFLRLVIIAFTLAIPVAWYLMQNWLTDFAYRIELRWWFFALAGIMAIGIAFLTVSFQSFKAAIVNPADSLKNE
ncbi:MAG: FtsX-like permease family protein, partial [Bacteroidota bacterium]